MREDCNSNEIKYSDLKKYFEGEPSKEKKEKIISWFQNPDYRFKFEQCLKELWKETYPDKVASLTSQAEVVYNLSLIHI